jgi:hypothetical protein
MTIPFKDLAELMATEEKAAFTNDLEKRIRAIEAMPDGPVRARIYAVCAMIGGAELLAHLEGNDEAKRQLLKLSERLKIAKNPLH